MIIISYQMENSMDNNTIQFVFEFGTVESSIFAD